jgi:hypothetical protein
VCEAVVAVTNAAVRKKNRTIFSSFPLHAHPSGPFLELRSCSFVSPRGHPPISFPLAQRFSLPPSLQQRWRARQQPPSPGSRATPVQFTSLLPSPSLCHPYPSPSSQGTTMSMTPGMGLSSQRFCSSGAGNPAAAPIQSTNIVGQVFFACGKPDAH